MNKTLEFKRSIKITIKSVIVLLNFTTTFIFYIEIIYFIYFYHYPYFTINILIHKIVTYNILNFYYII